MIIPPNPLTPARLLGVLAIVGMLMLAAALFNNSGKRSLITRKRVICGVRPPERLWLAS